MKKCRVISRNNLVMVVAYEDLKIQLPSDKSQSEYVYVKKENDKYVVVNESEATKYAPAKTKTVEKKLINDAVIAKKSM